MTEFWMFIATLAVGAVWLAIGTYVIGMTEYGIDHAGGWLNGMTPEEVNEVRKWRDHENLV